MKIFARAATDLADTFLHAGYLSASGGSRHLYDAVPDALPATTELTRMPTREPTFVVDLAEAFQTAVEPAAGAASSAAGPGFTVAAAALVAALVPCSLALVRAMERRWPVRTARLRSSALVGLAVAAGIAWIGAVGLAAAPGPVHADEPAGPTYANPDLATRAILYGFVHDTLAAAKHRPFALNNIDDDIGLPVEEPTAAEARALAEYESDGWGRAFAFTRDEDLYTVTSAGADAEPGTQDDIAIQVRRPSRGADYHPLAFFAQRVRSQGRDFTLVYYRTFSGNGFPRWLPQRSEVLTGGGLFDELAEFHDDAHEATVRELAAVDGSLTLLFFADEIDLRDGPRR